MKLSFIVFLVVASLWMLVGTNWYVCYIKDECIQQADVVAPDPQEAPVVAGEVASVAEEVKEVVELKKDLSQFEVIDGAILFGTGQVKPENSEDVMSYLKSVAEKYIASETSDPLIVTGHTDNLGPVDVNYRIGENRARAIGKILVAYGVPAESVDERSMGPDAPKGDNTTPKGRKLNRRVEVNF